MDWSFEGNQFKHLDPTHTVGGCSLFLSSLLVFKEAKNEKIELQP